MEETAVGDVMKLIQRRQVELIKSLPIEAGLRAQKLSQEAVMGGKRADEVAAELMKSGEVTESRATLIARTEIAKANAALTQARAGYVGATHYIWRTAEDGDVRESHAVMEGKIFRFDDPPYVEGEGNHGPGEFPNCRCFAEPIIPE
jgi:SPP1 gp7 family putative phage head morphogenesis protein